MYFPPLVNIIIPLICMLALQHWIYTGLAYLVIYANVTTMLTLNLNFCSPQFGCKLPELWRRLSLSPSDTHTQYKLSEPTWITSALVTQRFVFMRSRNRDRLILWARVIKYYRMRFISFLISVEHVRCGYDRGATSGPCVKSFLYSCNLL